MDSSKSDLKLWKFRVRDDSFHPGTMCITGDCDTLGNWSTENIIPMTYDCAKKIWTVVVYLPYDRIVNYRYLICTRIDSTNPIKTMIHKWETNLQPRSVKFNEISDESNEKIDVFGVFENTQKIENGWLTSDVVVQLTLHSDAIQWHTPNDDENKKVYIKLLPALKSNNIQSGKGCSEISISVSNENGKFRKQDEAGYAFHDASSAVFMTRAFTVDKLGFVFEFTDTSCEEKKKLFSFLALEDRFHNTCGVITVPIHSDQHEYLGTLSVKYLIVRPLPELNCKLKVSYAKYWNNAWTGLEIGHRGSGVSFTNSKEKNAKWRENTIGSFKEAGQLGAHLIEFDVQLTNDFIPTIYHDFHVLLDVHKRKDFNTGGRKMIFPFHKLNYEELKDFKVMHLNESNLTFSFENDDQEEYSPFPSLEQVLQQIDPQIGFNIEIKYNSQLEDGSNELDHPIDMNEYVDRILKVVYANGGRRYIVFSSFNPDVCLMLRTKQNKYPVMFLTQGITKRYPPYSDERMRDIDKAVKFANSADLLGIVAHSEELLQNIDYVQYVLENDLVLFCWGDDNNDINTISALREKGVHGIIFDRIDQYGQKLKKNFFQDGLVN